MEIEDKIPPANALNTQEEEKISPLYLKKEGNFWNLMIEQTLILPAVRDEKIKELAPHIANHDHYLRVRTKDKKIADQTFNNKLRASSYFLRKEKQREEQEFFNNLDF